MKKKNILFLVLIFCFFAPAAFAQTKTKAPQEKTFADLRAFVDKSVITIAEPVKFTIEIDADDSLAVEFPYAGNNLGGFVVKDFSRNQPKKIGEHKLRRQQWYLLDTYTTGSYVIPEQAVKVKLPEGTVKTLKTAQIFVEVKSVIEEGEDKGLRDIKSPLFIKPNLIWVWVLGMIFLIVISAAGGWMIYKKKFMSRKVAAPEPAHVQALKQLKEIQSLRLIDAGKIKEYYYRVNNCLRIYLENRFALKAPEQTTEEFLEFVTTTSVLNSAQIGILKEYLMHCDLVKYAKLTPQDKEPEKIMHTTQEFIEQTKQAETDDDLQDKKKIERGL